MMCSRRRTSKLRRVPLPQNYEAGFYVRLNLITSLIVSAGVCGGVYGSIAPQQARSANTPSVRHVAVPTVVGHPASFAPRAARTRQAVRRATVTPPGCSSNGPVSFLGAGSSNFAGGAGSSESSYAAVVNGTGNEACDQYASILDGSSNVIGGDESATGSGIVTGTQNSIENATFSLIGSGSGNSISSNTEPSGYGNASTSSIATGTGNSIGAPLSFIGGGSGNQIMTIPFVTGKNGQSAFIGAGTSNIVGGPFSAIVAGSGNEVDASYSSIGSGSGNSVQGGSTQGTTSPNYSFIGGGSSNEIAAGNDSNAGYGFIGGGSSNSIAGSIDTNDLYNVIAGGEGNTVSTANSGTQSTRVADAIGGGYKNTVTDSYTTIAGGYENSVTATYSAVGGGSSNAASGQDTVVAGGYKNSASGNFTAIGGGHLNVASGVSATVVGGYENMASGQNGTTVGGAYNVAAGRNSFAAGKSSMAATDGSFVWSDYSSNATTLTASQPDQFLARSAGGFYLYSSANLSSGVELAPGSGSWANLSDRHAKTGVVNVDPSRILARLTALPVSEWSYSAQGIGVRHIGPMAQDFRAAFGLGEDDRHISTIDEDGVTLVAVKALVTEVRAKSSEVERLRAAIAHVSSDEQQLKNEVRELLAHARSDGRPLTVHPSQSRT